MASDAADRGAPGPQSVAAVVVTYNRKDLLKRCLDALLGQTRPLGRVMVIDNCSTDGTAEFLQAEGLLAKPVVEYVRLAENMGGAGGFHEGMKRAYEQGYDWLWVMDDDGLPTPEALARLLESPAGARIRGCKILTYGDLSEAELAYNTATPSGVVRRTEELERLADSDGVADVISLPFNGVLISREIVRTTGLPKKEFFIWGDDVEYFLRARKAGFRTVAVLSAKFLHPADRVVARRFHLGPISFGLPYSDDPFRFYLLVRNHTFISLRYDGMFSKKFLKLGAYLFLFPGRSKLILQAWFEAITGRMAVVRPGVR